MTLIGDVLLAFDWNIRGRLNSVSGKAKLIDEAFEVERRRNAVRYCYLHWFRCERYEPRAEMCYISASGSLWYDRRKGKGKQKTFSSIYLFQNMVAPVWLARAPNVSILKDPYVVCDSHHCKKFAVLLCSINFCGKCLIGFRVMLDFVIVPSSNWRPWVSGKAFLCEG